MSRRPAGVVAAGHLRTAQAAESVLRGGGNAFDAMIAAYFAACVAEPVLLSLAGGGFLLARSADGQRGVFDFFVHTPGRRRPVEEIDFRPILADFGAVRQEFHIGLGSVAVPGAVRGLFELHRRLGSVPMRELVRPAVDLAREGVVVDHLQAYIFSVVQPIFLATEGARSMFESERSPGRLKGEGERLKMGELADFIEVLAIEGEDLFYRGEVAQWIADACRGSGGHLTLEDLAGYEVVQREPLELDYRQARVFTNPPPSSGGILIAFALRLLEPLDMKGLGPGTGDYLRMLAQVMAATNQARVEAHLDATQREGVAGRLLDPDYLARYRAQVRGRYAARTGTTHIGIIDGQGNVAAMTGSNGEGCGVLVPGTGVMLNNMLGEQDLNPDGFHRWPEAQRMTSMMAPSLIAFPDGRMIATGSGGSNRIRTALLQVLINLLDHEMSVEEAVWAPRIHFESGLLNVEAGFSQTVLADLLAEVPEAKLWDSLNLFFGGAHTVELTANGAMGGAGDPRRGGVCLHCAVGA